MIATKRHGKDQGCMRNEWSSWVLPINAMANSLRDRQLVNSGIFYGQTIVQHTGEFVEGQTIVQLTGELVDGQTISQPTGEFVDGQRIGQAT